MREFLSTAKAQVEAWIAEIVTRRTDIEPINDAVKYSLQGGKRLRPILAMLGCEFMDKPINSLRHFAVGLECIHNYSLIHDDLPCMDDDTLRHGKPCTHVKFGEGMAVLAGDALLNLAYEIMLRHPDINADYVSAIRYAAAMAGIDGMIGGQCLDIVTQNSSDKYLHDVIRLNSLKTACLFKAGLVGGAIACGASSYEVTALEEYSDCLGIIFQIVDDILDITSTEETLGKNIGSDIDSNKVTYVSLVGIEQARGDIRLYEQKAQKALEPFGARADRLIQLVDYLSARSN